MNILKNNKGFTLFELIAVIAILAVVMSIAVFVALPLLDTSKEAAFAISANTVVEAAKNIELSAGVTGTAKTCYSLEEMINDGYVARIDLPKPIDATDNGFNGIVVIEDDKYTLHLIDYANNFRIVKDVTTNGEVVAEDITTYRNDTPLTSCP